MLLVAGKRNQLILSNKGKSDCEEKNSYQSLFPFFLAGTCIFVNLPSGIILDNENRFTLNHGERRWFLTKPVLEKGQGLLEYALIMVLVVVIVIVVVALIGPQVGRMYSNVVVLL